MAARHLLFFFALPALGADFFPMSVWYGGGKARAPMLAPQARANKEVWRKDLRQIKALGFNTVRTWLDWATGEPRAAQYQFENLDVILELAQEEGLKVFLQMYMDSAPAWVGRQYPDSLFVSASGAAVKPESSPGYCLDHPGVRKADLAFYGAVAQRVKGHPAFAGWDLWSEPHVINWANPTYIPNPEFCFCPHTLAKFRAWLRRKYGSIGKLNQAWYRTYETWEEVEPGRMSTILSFTDYIDWKAFLADKLGEDLRDRYNAVKQVVPQSTVTSHAAGVGLFASPHHWEGQADDWTMARQVDFYGTSFYPKHSAFVDRDLPWRAALLDFTRSFGFAGGRGGFYIGELQAGFGTIALNVSPTVTPADLRIWTWSALARGAKGIHYYAWYPMSTGYESGGFGMIHLDGTITERARIAGAIARTVDRHQNLFLAARPPRAQIAVIYNPLAHFVGGRQRAAVYGGPQGEVIGIERDSLLGIHRALFPRNVPVDYVHIDHLEPGTLQGYKLVYLPYPLMLPEAAAAPLRNYVEQGGALVAEARLGWSNERGVAANRIPGMGLDEVMGARERDVQTVQAQTAVLEWTAAGFAPLPPGARIPGRWYEEALEPSHVNARVAARFPGGAPAAVLSNFGQGKTLLLGSYVSAAYQAKPTQEGEQFFAALLGWANVTPPLTVTPEGVEARLLEAAGSRLLFVFNHRPEAVTAAIEMPGMTKAEDLLTGEPVSSLRRELASSDVWVVKLTP
ncbi:MAG: beta-galactosidase [Bryobacterales bacterium]|nr:beta-galactosidase [Bryobacterales bacterium]